MQMQPLKGSRVFYPMVDTSISFTLFSSNFYIFFIIFNFKQFLYRLMQAVCIDKEIKWVLGDDISSSVQQVVSVLD